MESIKFFAKGYYPELFDINISHNNIRSLLQLNTPQLKVLECSNNMISDLKDFCKGVYPKLIIIDLASNKLKYLPKIDA
jgi:hypothetical protein